jgi:hypothetical protein
MEMLNLYSFVTGSVFEMDDQTEEEEEEDEEEED